MLGLGIAYALLGAISFALFDALRKKVSPLTTPAALVTLITLLMTPFMALWVAWEGWRPVGWGYAVPGGAAIAAQIAGNLMFLRAVTVSPLSTVIPLLSLTPLLAALLAWPLRGDVPDEGQWFGMVLVVTGVFFVFTPRGAAPLGVLRRLTAEPGAAAMLMATIAWSIAAPIDQLAMDQVGRAMHGLLSTAGLTLCMLLWLGLRRQLRHLVVSPRSLAWVGLTAIAGVAAVGFQLAALGLLLAGVVEAIKRVVGQIAALIIGRVVFAEPFTRPKILGVVFMSVGIPMVLLA